ncbi:MFS transporter [Kribbella sp. NPDC023855]|uniref:MFS transporter n=1 Tax=Kribbella sp. NPDC023855 TaxID=3154698 RepID=UPI0033C99A49
MSHLARRELSDGVPMLRWMTVETASARPPVRSFASMVAAVALFGCADSMTGSYLVLFASEEADLSPLRVGLFVSAVALGGILVSTVFGRRFDRSPTRGWVVVAAVASAAGFALVPWVDGFWPLMLIGVTLLGAAGAGYPQLFALADIAFEGAIKKRVAPLLRSGWSLAWAVGPLLGAWLLGVAGYSGLFRVAAVVLVLTMGVVALVPRAADVASGPGLANPSTSARSRPRGPVVLLTAAMVLVHTAMFAGSVALPLYVTAELDRPSGDVGLIFSACAVVEIAAALLLVWVLPRVRLQQLVLAGLVLFIAYFVVAALAESLSAVLIAQLARGAAIAVIGTAGMQLFQAVLAPASGTAAALFSNAATAGSLVSGVLAGALIQLLGTRATLVSCGVLCVAACGAFWAANRLHRRAPDDPPSGGPSGDDRASQR